MALTDTLIRAAKPASKPFKLIDEKGMYLYVSPTGGKLWRLKYRVDGKEKLLSMGAKHKVGELLAKIEMSKGTKGVRQQSA